MALNPSTGWNYYKQIDITDNSSHLSGSQLSVYLISGTGGTDIGSIFSGTIYLDSNTDNWPCDIRFGNTNNPSTAYEIPQWFESSSNTEARIWIRPSGTNTTLYIFVGNSTAEFYSSGHQVWDFFDDYHSAPSYDGPHDGGSTVLYSRDTNNIKDNIRVRMDVELSGCVAATFGCYFQPIISDYDFDDVAANHIALRWSTDSDSHNASNDNPGYIIQMRSSATNTNYGLWTASTIIKNMPSYAEIRYVKAGYASGMLWSNSYSLTDARGTTRAPNTIHNFDYFSLYDGVGTNSTLTWLQSHNSMFTHQVRGSSWIDMWRHFYCLGKWETDYPIMTSFGSWAGISPPPIIITNPEIYSDSDKYNVEKYSDSSSYGSDMFIGSTSY